MKLLARIALVLAVMAGGLAPMATAYAAGAGGACLAHVAAQDCPDDCAQGGLPCRASPCSGAAFQFLTGRGNAGDTLPWHMVRFDRIDSGQRPLNTVLPEITPPRLA